MLFHAERDDKIMYTVFLLFMSDLSPFFSPPIVVQEK